ncbi:MAG: META domain-containing protein [Theionarchaea archaeon]|nr:META domain-containing protein [Theionarchaea archaeon]
MKKSSLVIIFLGLAIGCIGQKPISLEGNIWILDSYRTETGLVTVLRDTRITAQFQDGRITGDAGCNSYFSEYTANKGHIEFGPVGVTEMYCSEPEGVMEQELDFLQVLESVEGYVIVSATLELTDAHGDVVLIFTVA